jgi:DNA repair photolyase
MMSDGPDATVKPANTGLAKRRLHEKRVKTLIRRSNLSGNFVVGKYRFSPYMACEHGCAYCDGRAERYYVEGEFDYDIVYRANAPDLLRTELPKLRERGFISLGSGVSDVYQPVEAELELTRNCLEILVEYPFPVTLMTKSRLALRDMDLWKRLAAGPGCMILTSLTFADDTIRQWVEPGASSVDDRLELLQAARNAGCHTGVLAMPLLPWITDTRESIEALYERIRTVTPDFIMPAGLTLRPGKQKNHFLSKLEIHRPELVADYKRIYHEDRPSGLSTHEYRESLHRRINDSVRREAIPFLVPHAVYAPKLNFYDSLQVLLSHMDELYASRGVATEPLQEGRSRYVRWLTEKKSWYNRRRSTSYSELDNDVQQAILSGELSEVIGNERMMDFIRKISASEAIYDYVDMRVRPYSK